MKKIMLFLYNKRAINKKAFSLIELIIVVAIIGVLLTIAVLSYDGITSDTQETSTAATIRTIEGAASMYHSDHGVYPNTIGDIDEKYLDVDLNDFKDLSTATPFDENGKLSN